MIRYNPEGLTSREVAESRERHGDNVITPPKDDSAWRLLAEKFRDPIIRILLLAAVLLIPPLEPLFQVAELSVGLVGCIVGLAFGSMVVIQVLKAIRSMGKK